MKINYNCNCSRPNFKNKYAYWEDREVTSDEREIITYLKNNINLNNKNILHIGIGNSYLSKELSKNNNIYGITVSRKEIISGNNLNLDNYKIFLCDKYSNNFMKFFENIKF